MSTKYPGGFITKSPTAPTTAAAKGIWTLNQVADYVKQGIWPSTPGAPTIGTATAMGSTAATVAFTPPTNLGSGTITYTATSSPGGLTGTGTSPITVTGLTTGTSYTFTVTASTPGGTGPASAASNSVTPTIQPGDAYQGGFYAGQIGVAGVPTHNLVVAPKSSGQSTGQWKNVNTLTPGAISDIDGPQNTADMVADGSSTVYPNAHFCNNLVTGGFSDWYMPAKNEAGVIYFNLKPTTTANITISGVNPNSIPPRAAPYSTGTPAQTSAANFISGAAEAFDAEPYWTSSQINTSYARGNNYSQGYQFGILRTYSFRVRAIRRVAV
jgi:hypothetical protein